jgi:tRNA A37 threonylcarbamoyladenosine dehydratase
MNVNYLIASSLGFNIVKASEKLAKGKIYIYLDGINPSPFNPSLSIEDAFLVIEKLKERGWILKSISHIIDSENNCLYKCELIHVDKRKKVSIVTNSLSLSISLASLKALEVM